MHGDPKVRRQEWQAPECAGILKKQRSKTGFLTEELRSHHFEHEKEGIVIVDCNSATNGTAQSVSWCLCPTPYTHTPETHHLAQSSCPVPTTSKHYLEQFHFLTFVEPFASI